LAFINFFSIKDLIPHGYCLAWSPLLLWLNVISDVLITLAYYSIPLTILYFLYQRKATPYKWLGLLFAVFILACGTAHLFSAITIWIPLYWLDGLFKAFTALISVITALSMLWVVPRALSLPTPSQLRAEIQQRKNAEKALLNTSNAFNKIARRVPGMVYQFYLSPDGKAAFPFVTEGIHDLFGLSPESVCEDASPLFALVHPEDLDGFFASIQTAVSNLAPWFYEFRVKPIDGAERWISGSSLPDQDDSGLWYWYGYMSDITLQKQLAENLRVSENMKRAILESSPDAIFSVDNDGFIKDYNSSTLSTFGFTANEINGKSWVDLFIPERFRDNYQLMLSEYTDHSKGRLENSRFELVGCHGSEEFPIEISITPIRINELNFSSVCIRDITESKQAEAILLKGHQQAEQANLVKSQFLAMMSHEIRTPLNVILGVQELLADSPLDTTQNNHLQLATNAGKSLLSLINDILDLTKVEAGKLDLEDTIFDAVDLAEQCVKLLSTKAQEKNLAISTQIAPELMPWISGDPWRFRQVLLNLLSNALKFTTDGSITVKLSPNADKMDAGVLLIEVIDTGIGINQDVQASLFEVFTQADPSDTRKYGGSGLGLAISKRLVALWGGNMGLDSRPGKGSRFWFSIGRTATAPQPLIPPEMIVAETHSPIVAKLLLVEDSKINQIVMSDLLEAAGHQVDVADCGTKGIAMASANHYDLIFMDVSMPDMTGMEATQQIRQLGGTAATVPIIAITGHALKGYQEMCLAAGMNGYATKPISKLDLLGLVDKWCDSAATAQFNPRTDRP
jgi:PAS domain S-box-containing protein